MRIKALVFCFLTLFLQALPGYCVTATRDSFPDFPAGVWIPAPPAPALPDEPQVTLIYFFSLSSNLSVYHIPFIQHLITQYDMNGFRVIGIHLPRFESDRSERNIKTELSQTGDYFPIFLDPESYYESRFPLREVPVFLLLDSKKMIRYRFDSSSSYEAIEKTIISLIEEFDQLPDDPIQLEKLTSKITAHQQIVLSLGTQNMGSFGSRDKIKSGQKNRLNYPENKSENYFYLEGDWFFAQDHIMGSPEARLSLKTQRRSIIILAEPSQQDATATITLNGQAPAKEMRGSDVPLDADNADMLMQSFKLYRLISHKTPPSAPYEIEIVFSKPVRIYEITLSDLDPIKIKVLKSASQKKGADAEGTIESEQAEVTYTYH